MERLEDLRFVVKKEKPECSGLSKGQIVKFKDNPCFEVTHDQMEGYYLIRSEFLELLTPTIREVNNETLARTEVQSINKPT